MMKSTLILLVSATLLFFLGSPRAQSQITLQCTAPATVDNPVASFVVEPGSENEKELLRKAPHGAARPSTHLLVVRWRAGSRSFSDKPPYMQGAMAGFYWTYCGFSREAGAHLIQKNDPGELFGTLVDEKTGVLLPGGFSVTFSPDQQAYMARINNDAGVENIKVYSRAGKEMWSRADGLVAPDGQKLMADKLSVHWDSSSNLVAEYKDAKGHQHSLTLSKTADGYWQWSQDSAR
jgi:hypothetical protein